MRKPALLFSAFTLLALLFTLAHQPARADLMLNQAAEPTPDEAEIKKLLQDAGNGDAKAALKLGVAYFEGSGVDADAQKAEDWLKKSLEGGNKEAATRLGYLYLQTSNQGKDVARASKGLDILRAGATEEATANITLGLLHLVGTYVPQDFDKAAGYFRKGAEMGEVDGYFYLGQMHSGELGFEDRVQPQKAVEYLTKSFEAGNFDAGQLLVKLLREGKRIVKDEKGAFDIVQQAAQKGNLQAKHFLGELYESGGGVEKDLAKARESYLAAAEAGSAQSQNRLGLIYGQGQEGLEPNAQESAKWFQMAAEQGFPLAHFNLALLIDTKKSPTRQEAEMAAAHLIAAANAGLPQAQDRLGSWYRDGRHVPKDLVAASSWFKPAANAGNLTSKINLAQILEATATEAEALKTALQLYADTAAAGHPVGHFHFARMLVSGRLGLVDFVTAYAHLSIAADAGFPLAIETLSQVQEKLNEEQLAKGNEIKSGLKSYKWQ